MSAKQQIQYDWETQCRKCKTILAKHWAKHGKCPACRKAKIKHCEICGDKIGKNEPIYWFGDTKVCFVCFRD